MRVKNIFKAFVSSREIIRLEFYVFLIFIISSIVVGYYTYQTQIAQLRDLIYLKQESNIQLFHKLLESDAEGLARAMEGFSQLEAVMEPFKAHDRKKLAEAVKPIFDRLRVRHAITHAYFIDRDGVVFLRAHKPEQYGDHLSRTTYIRSSISHDLSCGIEMGRNFFSLRCVRPIFFQQEFIGYLGMAQEIDQVFHEMKRTVDEDFSLLLTQDYLDKHQSAVHTIDYGSFHILETTNAGLVEAILGRINPALVKGQPSHQFVSHHGHIYAVYMGPFKDAAGETPGVIMTLHDVTHAYDKIWSELLINAVLYITIILGSAILIVISTSRSISLLESRVAERTRQIERIAYHDSLTGLPNRAMFSDFLGQAIARARRYQQRVAVLFIDLDNFKIINDTLGHHAGDDLLRECSARIKACLRESDFVARLGGDEFVVILPEILDSPQQGREREKTVAGKILESLAKPFVIHERSFNISASIGISIYPVDGQDESTLTRHADIAMYEAKGSGKNKFRQFSRDLMDKVSGLPLTGDSRL